MSQYDGERNTGDSPWVSPGNSTPPPQAWPAPSEWRAPSSPPPPASAPPAVAPPPASAPPVPSTPPVQSAPPVPSAPPPMMRPAAPYAAPVPNPPAPGPYVPRPPAPYAHKRPGPSVTRAEPVPGTEFGVLYIGVPALQSGLAIGSLVAGIGSILVSFVVGCFGLVGGEPGWGPAISGAFVVLATIVGLAAIGLGVLGLRQVRRSSGAVAGRGLAIAGITTGGSGLGLTLLAFLLAIAFVAAAE